jgi:xanthine dehydrogenase YagS FAD-binding subunit
VTVHGCHGRRDIPFADLHRLPGDTPDIETQLESGELITAVTLPPNGFPARSEYRKVRDRASYAFALVSTAAALDVQDGLMRDVRLALGGVAHKPWRARQAEAVLEGRPPSAAAFREAAEAELVQARPLPGNAFKIELTRRLIVDTLGKLAQPGELGS